MKKIIVMMLAVVLFAGVAQAQKNTKTPAKTPAKASSAAKTVSSTKAVEVVKLPMPEVGMDMPLHDAFMKRCTVRDMKDEELPMEIVSSLLWSAYGINRVEDAKRVVPSAVNVQEFDIYLFTKDGVYLYDAADNTLSMVCKEDHRKEISTQKHFQVAPVSVVIVANYDRMKRFEKTEDRDFYAAVDCGYVSQNIYLFCASADLGTVACGGIDRTTIHKILGITNGRAMLAHPVGIR